MKKNFVKQEHYIPQFALKFFQTKNNQIQFTNIENKPLELLFASTSKLMQEKDFYEIKDSEERYILRNSIEDNYSYIESEISPNYKWFISQMSLENYQEEFIKMVEDNKWSDIEANLLLHLILLLIRGKEAKRISYSKSKLPKNYQHILHLLMTADKSKTAEFAKRLYDGEKLEGILNFIKNDTKENVLKTLAEHIMLKYQIRVCKVKGIRKLFLSDNPVIVQKFEGEDYILPLSPDVCIILIPMVIENEIINVDTHVYTLDENAVDKINRYSIMNTDRLIIISDSNDLEFIENLL